MIATNLLLAFTFSALTNSSEFLGIPAESVPGELRDLRHYAVGSPRSPLDVYLVSQKGFEFWFRDTVLYRFRSPRSFFQLQDPSGIDPYTGVASLSTNNAVDLATKLVKHFLPEGRTFSGGTPVVQMGGMYKGQSIPFYKVTFPSAKGDGLLEAASVEIDGRTGQIVFLQLLDPVFFDPGFAQRLREIFYRDGTRERTNQTSGRVPVLSHPEPNYLYASISNWLGFCEELKLEPGVTRENLRVELPRTWLYTNMTISSTTPICQVWLTNGVCFEAVKTIPRGHFSADSFFTGAWTMRSKEKAKFTGQISFSWLELAKDLEAALTDKLRIPEAMLGRYVPEPTMMSAPSHPGTQGFTRVLVEWRDPSERLTETQVAPRKAAIRAEFDVEKGTIKSIEISSPELVEALLKTRGETLR